MTIHEEERSAALKELERSRRRVLAAVDGLTQEQWLHRPSSTAWSIAECAEHIAAAEILLPKLLAVATPGNASERTQDDAVRRFLADRSRRDEAPERLRPRGRWATREETIEAFEKKRAANLEFARTTQEDLRGRFFQHPFAGPLDAFQWILFVIEHSERHAEQIEEIRHGRGFPSSTGPG